MSKLRHEAVKEFALGCTATKAWSPGTLVPVSMLSALHGQLVENLAPAQNVQAEFSPNLWSGAVS